MIYKKLDQFYTNPEAVDLCWKKLNEYADLRDFRFIEPSAGTGEWLRVLPPDKTEAYDIDPKHPKIIKRDFFEIKPPILQNKNNIIVVGNPPFGHRNALSEKFVLQSFMFADTVAFILSSRFNDNALFAKKFAREGIKLKLFHRLPADSFYTLENSVAKSYPVETGFYILSRLGTKNAFQTEREESLDFDMLLCHPRELNGDRGASHLKNFDFFTLTTAFEGSFISVISAEQCLKSKTPIFRWKAKNGKIRERLLKSIRDPSFLDWRITGSGVKRCWLTKQTFIKMYNAKYGGASSESSRPIMPRSLFPNHKGEDDD